MESTMIENRRALPEAPQGRIATVGTFDGLHRGHVAVIDCLRREGRDAGLRPLLVTFSNHPLDIVAPERAPGSLCGADEKRRVALAAGIDGLIETFSPELCALTARQWLERLRDDLMVRALVVGYDNTFGCDGRSMIHSDYRELCRSLGLRYVEAPKVEGCSSSAVRRALAAGDVELAARILGHPYRLAGEVVHGDALGRTIGVPTANLRPFDPRRIIPADGVYAAVAHTDAAGDCAAVVNIGRRPTVAGSDDAPLRIEAHLIDVRMKHEIYGDTLTLDFLRRLRPERRFGSLEELKSRIASDIAETKRLINKV